MKDSFLKVKLSTANEFSNEFPVKYTDFDKGDYFKIETHSNQQLHCNQLNGKNKNIQKDLLSLSSERIGPRLRPPMHGPSHPKGTATEIT